MDPMLAGLDDIVVGMLLVAIGLAAIAFGLLRRRPRIDPLFTSFGAFALLYGLRLLVGGKLAPALGIGDAPRGWVTSWATYAINVPAVVFFSQVFSGKWRTWMRRWLWVIATFAVLGAIFDLIVGEPGTLSGLPNNLLVLANIGVLTAVLIAHRRRRSLDQRLLILGLTVLGLFAVNENLVSLGLLPWRFQEESLGFLVFVACLGTIAARRAVGTERQLAGLEGELEAARRIQRSLLPPKLPESPSLALAIRFRPTAAVAGDFYDLIPLAKGRFGLLLADVSGHGVPAALVASMVKVALAAHAEHAERPAALLAAINRTLRGSIGRAFVTAVYVRIDADGHGLRAASAGHPFPLLYRAADGSISEIAPGGPVLGRFDQAQFAESTVSLEPGDRVLLYTDGLTEALSGKARGHSDAMFGEARLRADFAAAGSRSAEVIAETLIDRLRAWRSRPTLVLDDDLTMIVLAKPAAPSTPVSGR